MRQFCRPPASPAPHQTCTPPETRGCRDLLVDASGSSSKALSVHEDKARGVYIEGAHEVRLRCSNP